ncbi:hypothetical protein TVAG_583550 [Trichomonas vaginalis G3]|uniref:Uncharacterized protein n=1 Tax=Trichomonas vaginalis (strain ATCC PRA-98 / G3) TaxID=412133 RepID=A2HZS0_TRIV3|nr:hypothetical protein TVAG_583550 [Trichomonas vaginalis G3]|eukprot:XP_001278027.1 hypothetical protein [Trichomonas vaginalis G3]
MRKRKEIEYVVSERIVKQYFVKYKDQHPEINKWVYQNEIPQEIVEKYLETKKTENIDEMLRCTRIVHVVDQDKKEFYLEFSKKNQIHHILNKNLDEEHQKAYIDYLESLLKLEIKNKN